MAPTVEPLDDPEAWQTARERTGPVHRLSNDGPFAKDNVLRGRMWRPAISALCERFESRTRPQMSALKAPEARIRWYIAPGPGHPTREGFESVHDRAGKGVGRLARVIADLASEPGTRRARESAAEYGATGAP